jgi:molybdopterin-guanine dinucleotide biosynthesis protein A
MFNAEGFILAGGLSTRMGYDKARLKLNGKSFVDHISRALRGLTDRISLVSSKPIDACWELPVVRDVYENCGALGGLHTALSSCRAPWAVVVACDLPLITTDFLIRLSKFHEGFEAVVPVQRNDMVQPLCALYSIDPCLERAKQLIIRGERRVHKLLEMVKTQLVREEMIMGDNPMSNLYNINTPEDYDYVRKDGDERL